MLTSALVLATWLLLVGGLAGIGLAISLFVLRTGLSRSSLEVGLWTAVSTLTALFLFSNFFLPLGNSVLWAGGIGLLAAGLVYLLIISAQKSSFLKAFFLNGLQGNRWSVIVFLFLIGLGLVIATRFATAEPMDADLGLYRLNLIQYAHEFPVIPGLANLHERFGFTSSVWPMSAVLSNGIWEVEGYRIITGLVLSLILVSLILRLWSPKRSGATPGDWFLAISAVFIAGLVVRDSGRWIASPSQDVIFLAISSLSMSFFIDAIWRRGRYSLCTYGALVTASLAGTVRPLGWIVFFVQLVILVGLYIIYVKPVKKENRPSASLSLVGVLISATLFAVTAFRDFLTSGWLLFPIPIVGFPVDWRFPNPGAVRDAITEYARAPGQADTTGVLENWDWLSSWTTGFLGSWEVRSMTVLMLLAIVPLLWRKGRLVWRSQLATLLMAVAPSVVLTAIWFYSAPDLRFGWTGLLGLVGIPLAVVVAGGAYSLIQFTAAGITAIVMSLASVVTAGLLTPRGSEFTVVTREVGPLSIDLKLAHHPDRDVVPGTLGDGTPIVYPGEKNDCWSVFPLCLPFGSGEAVETRGIQITDGFRPIQTTE